MQGGAVLKVMDEHFGPGGTRRSPAVELRIVSERIAPREVIRRRVEAEVEALNEKRLARASALNRTRSLLIEIDAASAEATLNAPLPGKRRPRLAQVEHETSRAIAAFVGRRFIMLFDDRQVDDLDAEVVVTPDTQVVFLYLTPLKGG